MSVMAKEPPRRSTKPKPSGEGDSQPAGDATEQPEQTDGWTTRSVRLPTALLARVEQEGARARRSGNLQIVWMLEELLRRLDEERKPRPS